MSIQIVGIDCATQNNKIGIARGIVGEDGKCKIDFAEACNNERCPKKIILDFCKESPVELLALDAPLGWPTKLGPVLLNHQAGRYLEEEASELFSRLTDKRIKLPLGRKPFEVGADKIARTSKAALTLLHELRKEKEEVVPLAWEMGMPESTSVIEVYPAATCYSLYSKVPVKGKPHERRRVIEEIQKTFEVRECIAKKAQESDHVFDAILCVIAAFEFINGRCQPPGADEIDKAKKEGWIWVGPPAKENP